MKVHLLTFTLFVLLVGLITQTEAKGVCVHDEITRGLKPQRVKLSEAKMRKLAGAPALLRPIEINFDYGGLRGVDQKKAEFIMNDLMPAVSDFFKNLLQVSYVPGHKWGVPIRQCVDINVPVNYMQPVIAADVLIFVSAKNEPSQNFVAWAATCSLDAISGRPKAGQVNFNSYHLLTDPKDYRAAFETTIHEIIHLLGFSKNLYDNYIDQYGRTLPKGSVYKNVVARGERTTIITLPGVADFTRKHFNCPLAEGAELENQGSEGTKGSHWERRNWMNEMMTASDIEGVVLSSLTLHLLAGTGWYKVDFNGVQELTWGKNAGCKFLSEPCYDKQGRRQYHGFCPALNVEGCSHRHYSKAHCSAGRPTKGRIPAHMDYLGGLASHDPFSDNCPYFQRFSNGDCRLELNKEKGQEWLFDQTWGPGSRCFSGNYFKESARLTTKSSARTHGTCHKFACKQDALGRSYVEVLVGAIPVACPSIGGPTKIPGYVGTLDCPAAEKFCLDEMVNECADKNFCGGVGLCWKGKCICPPGHFLDSCSKPLLDCSRTDCSKHGRCVAGKCVCDTGYMGLMCERTATRMNCPMCPSGICHGKQCIASLNSLFA